MDDKKVDYEITPSQPAFKPLDQARLDQVRLDRALDADRRASMADEGGAAGAWRDLREQLDDDSEDVSATVIEERRAWRELAVQRRWAIIAAAITATAAGFVVGFTLWRRHRTALG